MEQSELLRFVAGTLEDLGIPYMVVGSFASTAYGEPRMTRDIDIVIALQRDQVSQLCAAFPPEDYHVNRDAAAEAVDHQSQFNVIHGASGNKIDFMISRDDAWGREQIARRQTIELLPDLDVYVASREDVIIGKLIYYQEGRSDKHIRDIAAILKVSSTEVDRGYVRRWAEQLGLTAEWDLAVARAEE